MDAVYVETGFVGGEGLAAAQAAMVEGMNGAVSRCGAVWRGACPAASIHQPAWGKSNRQARNVCEKNCAKCCSEVWAWCARARCSCAAGVHCVLQLKERLSQGYVVFKHDCGMERLGANKNLYHHIVLHRLST